MKPLVREVEKTKPSVRIVPKKIPNLEKKLLCSTFLDAVICFYKDTENETAFKNWITEKGEDACESKNS